MGIMLIDRRTLKNIDWLLLLALSLVITLGLIVLYSAGYNPDREVEPNALFGFAYKSQAFYRQAIFIFIGFAVLFAAMLLPTTLIQRSAYIIYFFSVALLIIVLKFGTIVNGARRWIALGAFNIQPGELVKLAVILAIARYLARNATEKRSLGISDLIVPGIILICPMLLVMSQPDLGTALSIGAIGGLMLLFRGINTKTLVIGVIIAAVAVVPLWKHLHTYQRTRVLVLFDSEIDPQGAGYHIMQSKIAVGSGGWFGRGYMRGPQSHLEFLPEHTTDFVFSVLGEEWGFFGAIVVLTAYIFLNYRLLRNVARARDTFSGFICFGVAAWFGFHTVINIGMVVGLVPVVGIPLPLFSYGGSAVLTLMCSLGIVVGVGMRRFQYLRGLAAAIFIAILMHSQIAQAEERREFPKPNNEEIARFLLALKQGREFEQRKAFSPELTKQQKTIWQGNEPRLAAEVQAGRLEFSLPARTETDNSSEEIDDPEKDSNSVPSKLIFTFAFKAKALRVFDGGSKGTGFDIQFGEHLMLQLGQKSDQKSFIVAVPRFTSKDGKGFIICPRMKRAIEDPEKNNAITTVFADSGLRLSAAKFEVVGGLTGRVYSGYGAGRAESWLFNSPLVAATIEEHDRQVSKDPRIQLQYRPIHTSASYDLPVQGLPRSDGLEARLELQNSAGYLRRVTRRALVNLIEFDAQKEGFELFIPSEGITQGSGICYGIWGEEQLEQEFDKIKPD